jgi:hypothetical protein
MSAADQLPGPSGIDDDVESLNEQIMGLKALGELDEVSEHQSYDVSIRWGTALAGRLARLVHYSSRGLLDAADELKFQALCAELRGLSDLIDRFGLAHPVFTDTPPAKARRHRVSPRTKSRRGLVRRQDSRH